VPDAVLTGATPGYVERRYRSPHASSGHFEAVIDNFQEIESATDAATVTPTQPPQLPTPQLHRDTVIAALPDEMAKEMGLKRGRTTGSIHDTGNVWLNELLRSDPNGFAFWVGSLEEAFVRILTTASMAENVAPLRRSTLERQIGTFLYANEQNPRRTTGPALLPERWIELLLSQ
jgi:hypothetical protein